MGKYDELILETDCASVYEKIGGQQLDRSLMAGLVFDFIEEWWQREGSFVR